jgi:hypothetical protein
MDLLSLLRLFIRHWRVTAPAALLTVIGLVVAVQSSSPTFESTGSVVLLSPPEPPDRDAGPEPAPAVGQNPFARYGDLSVVADILTRVMNSDSKRAEFESKGVTGYTVVSNPGFQRGPVVDVTGQGPNPEAASRSAELVLGEVDTVLSELQRGEGADPNYFINTAPLDSPSTATVRYGSTLRVAIAALALGVLCTLGLAVLAEALARRRTVRPTTAADDTPAGGPGTDGGTSNGAHKADWSVILAALRSARTEPGQREATRQKPSRGAQPKHEPAWQTTFQQEPEKHEPAWQTTFQQEPEKHEPTWQTTQQEPSRLEPEKQEEPARQTTARRRSGESPANNGHKRPTTDRSP